MNQCYQLSHHVLAILDPDRSLAFYQDIVGMALMATQECQRKTLYYLGFGSVFVDGGKIPRYPQCVLELVFDPERKVILNNTEADETPGYWKIALAVVDLEVARQSLLRQGVEVSAAVQVADVAYLCHFEDPDGYCIELIQQRMQENRSVQAADPRYALHTPTSFSLVTCRVKDPQLSLEFYRPLGLRLISRQQVKHRGFTLYFLSADSEAPPSNDIDNIEMREWLWQRPYALLELQHVWGTESRTEFSYRSDAATGFEGIRLLTSKLSGETHTDPCLNCESVELVDPDGYRVQLLQVERDANR